MTTTVEALLDGEPIPAKACDPTPIALPAGQQELLISPGSAFFVDGVALTGPLAAQIPTATTTPAVISTWGADRREITSSRAPVARVLAVPKSGYPGWVAHTPDGVTLTPVIVNGWQQGWVVPAGEQGTITLTFPSNAAYRTGLAVGLSLLPLLLLLALVPRRGPEPIRDPAQPWAVPLLAAAAVLAAGAVIAGIGGMLVFGGSLAAAYTLRNRQWMGDRLTLGAASGGLILAGAVLSRYPWRSVDGYVGHSPWVQLLALVSLGVLAASVVPGTRPSSETGEPPTVSR